MTSSSALKPSIAHFANDVRAHRERVAIYEPFEEPLRSCMARRGLLTKQDDQFDFSLGEILPIVFYELAGLRRQENLDITEAWYRLYHATILIDDISDGDCELNVRTFLEAIALTQEATARFLGICRDSRTTYLVQDELRAAIRGQEADVALQGIASPDRRFADFEKNRLVRALAIVVGSRSENRGDLVAIADRMIPVFQMLDDLGDLYEDHRRKNWTGLLVRLLSPAQLTSLPGGEKHLVWEILKSRKLSSLLTDLHLELINLGNIVMYSKRTVAFFSELANSLSFASAEIRNLELLVEVESIDPDLAKEKFDKIAVIVAQSS